MKIHIVQKGDTLWEIAKKYGVNFEELKKLNSQLSNPDMIMPGMKVKVPTAGGSIKKEAPIAGFKKEQPIIKEQPIKKEQPIEKEQPIVKEQPIIKEQPKPKKEMPKKEKPKEKPHTPKMPTPIIPEIDIHNYYSMNMTNIDVDVDIEEKPVPKKPVKNVPVMKEEPKAEVCPPIIPYQPYCYEISPMMPGSGFPPGVCIPEGVPMDCYPVQHTSLPGSMPMHGIKHKWEESSSSYASPFTPAAQPFQHAHVGGNPVAGHKEMPVQQPYQQHGLQPMSNYPMQSSHEMQESSSNYANVAPATYQAPMQLPYKDDCGCGGSAVPYPSQMGGEAQFGGYQGGEQFGPGAAGMQQGFNPGMGGQPQFGGFPGGEQFGQGAAGMQQGFNPGMGGQPQFGGFPGGEQFGQGAAGMEQGFNPGMGGQPQFGGFPGGEQFGQGAAGMEQGFNPGMGGQPQFGGFPGGEQFDPGIAGMEQGFNPEMGGLPMTGGPGYPFGGGMPGFMQEPPYPQGTLGNVPMETGTGAPGMQGMPGGGQGARDVMAPTVYGPGGNAPIFAPPFQGNGQPPLVNPYGINEITPFGMPRYLDESSDYEN